jgi:hypothetical protein
MNTSRVFLTLALLGMATARATAKDDCGSPNCCAKCGCHVACVEKVCQIVCDVKKEAKHCWCVECKDICPLLPTVFGRDCCQENTGDGKTGGSSCEDGCKDCGHAANPPHCGHPRQVKTLVRKDYTVEVPVYKGVVKYLCPACNSNAATPEQHAGHLSPVPVGAPPMPPAASAGRGE